MTSDASWLGAVLLLLKVSCIVCGAWGITALLRHSVAQLRHIVWIVSIAALVSLPALVVLLPGWQVMTLETITEPASGTPLSEVDASDPGVTSFAPAHAQKVFDVAEPGQASSTYS